MDRIGHRMVPVSGMTSRGRVSLIVDLWYVRERHTSFMTVVKSEINPRLAGKMSVHEIAMFYQAALDLLETVVGLELEQHPDTDREEVAYEWEKVANG